MCRLHRLFTELIPGGAPRQKSVDQYPAAAGTGVRPRDQVGRTRRRMAADQVRELVRLDTQMKASKKELKAAVLATGSTLINLYGVGPVNAARIADVGDIARFPSKAHFASWNSTAPLDASSGEQLRHRLSRAGNRRVNRALHSIAAVQLRHETPGKAYWRRRTTAPASPATPCAA